VASMAVPAMQGGSILYDFRKIQYLFVAEGK
jgi:hypothetical protein